jgi:excisionase family DNA binding protein
MNKLLTPHEVAELLSVRPSTIYQWTHQGFIPHVKLGRLVRFNETAVMKWVEERSENGRKTRRVEVDEILQ